MFDVAVDVLCLVGLSVCVGVWLCIDFCVFVCVSAYVSVSMFL